MPGFRSPNWEDVLAGKFCLFRATKELVIGGPKFLARCFPRFWLPVYCKSVCEQQAAQEPKQQCGSHRNDASRTVFRFLAPASQTSELEAACFWCKGSGALLQDRSEALQHAAPGTGNSLLSVLWILVVVHQGGWVESQDNGWA